MPTALEPPYLHFTAIAGILLLLSLYYFIQRVRGAFSQLRRKWHPPSPFDPHMLRYQLNGVKFWTPFLILFAFLVGFAFYLSRYQYIAEKAQPAGSISYSREHINYVNDRGISTDYQVRGGRAAAGGIFLRFPKWLKVLGLQNYHQVVTFRTMDQREYHYNQPDPEWISDYADPLYSFFYRNRNWLKIPETSYIESPYFSGGKRKLFVTRSGYIVD
jgi:hypothetical protein